MEFPSFGRIFKDGARKSLKDLLSLACLFVLSRKHLVLWPCCAPTPILHVRHGILHSRQKTESLYYLLRSFIP